MTQHHARSLKSYRSPLSTPFSRLPFSSLCFHTNPFNSQISVSYPKHQLPLSAYARAHCLANLIFLLSKTMLLAELTGPLE